MSQNTLLDHVKRHIPPGFIAYLAQRQLQVFHEAEATAFNDPRWTRAEGRMLAGDLERAMFESLTRKAATKYRLRWKDIEHQGGNASCVHVYAGNLRLTTHRVPSPRFFVRPCESRREDAYVNKFMDGYVLEGSLCAPLPSLADAEQIRLYILHGAVLTAQGERKAFIQLAAPDATLEQYQWICSFGELQQAYLADSREANRESGSDASVLPRLKKNRKTENE